MSKYNNVKSLQNCKMKLFYSLQCHYPFKSKTKFWLYFTHRQCVQITLHRTAISSYDFFMVVFVFDVRILQMMQKNIAGRWNIFNRSVLLEKKIRMPSFTVSIELDALYQMMTKRLMSEKYST